MLIIFEISNTIIEQDLIDIHERVNKYVKYVAVHHGYFATKSHRRFGLKKVHSHPAKMHGAAHWALSLDCCNTFCTACNAHSAFYFIFLVILCAFDVRLFEPMINSLWFGMHCIMAPTKRRPYKGKPIGMKKKMQPISKIHQLFTIHTWNKRAYLYDHKQTQVRSPAMWLKSFVRHIRL